MKCPHCGVEAHFRFQRHKVETGRIHTEFLYQTGYCLSDTCGELVFQYALYDAHQDEMDWLPIVPAASIRGPVPSEVPSVLAQDYIEVCNVLPISSKASAALARRCLQNILGNNGYDSGNLAKEINSLLNETDAAKAIPQSLHMVIDAVRNFGNFSAHPITNKTTLQIIDVEPEEAEWCLEVIEECFQHFYVRPSRAAARKAALNAKLSRRENHQQSEASDETAK